MSADTAFAVAGVIGLLVVMSSCTFMATEIITINEIGAPDCQQGHVTIQHGRDWYCVQGYKP